MKQNLENRVNELHSERLDNIKHLKDDSLIEILNKKPLFFDDNHVYYYHQLISELDKRKLIYSKFNFLYEHNFDKRYCDYLIKEQQERFSNNLIVTNRKDIANFLRLLHVDNVRILSSVIDIDNTDTIRDFLSRDYNSAFFMDFDNLEVLKQDVDKIIKTGHSVIINTQDKENIDWDNYYNLKYELNNSNGVYIKVYKTVK